MKTIPFIVANTSSDVEDDEKGIFSNFYPDASLCMQNVPVGELKTNLVDISSSILEVVDSVKQVGRFKLKKVTLQVEVSADGGVSLIGTAKVGGKGAITLSFEE